MVENTDAASGMSGVTDGLTGQTYETDQERAEGYEQWRKQQHEVDAAQREADADHEVARDEFLQLEAEVDEHVEDSIRWAETTIAETKEEINNCNTLLNENSSLLERVQAAINAASAAPAPEVLAEKQQLESQISQIEQKKTKSKKLVNQMTDEKIRLQEFKRPKIVYRAQATVPSHIVAPRHSEQPVDRHPVHLGDNFGGPKNAQKTLTPEEARELVNRLSQRAANRAEWHVHEMFRPGYATSHI